MQPLIVTLDFLVFPEDSLCGRGGGSPRIRLRGLGAETTSVAVMAVNPFIKTCCSFSPWLIWNLPPDPVIPPEIPTLPTVEFPVHAVQGSNDFGKTGFTGPCPGPGEMHRYTFKVYALDAMLALPPGSRKHELIAAMRGHVIQYGETAAVAAG